MIDLKEYLESRFQEYYKAKPGFGNTMEPDNRQTRIDTQNLVRKQYRTNVLLERRNIIEMEVPTPEVRRTERGNKPSKEDRMTLLKRWKAEKENKLKKEKAKKKPIFKNSCPVNVGFPGLAKSGMTDKVPAATKTTGEPSTSKSTDKILKKSFAPNNHKFNAPKNVNTINMSIPNKSKQKSKILNFNLKPTEPKSKSLFNRVTRSQKSMASPPLPLPARRKRNEILVESNVIKSTVTKQKNKNEEKSASNTKQEIIIKRNSKGRLLRQNAIEEQNDDGQSSNENEEPKEEVQKVNVKTPQRQSRRKSGRKSTALQEQFKVDEVKDSGKELKLSGSSSSENSTVYSSDHNQDNVTDDDNVFVSDNDNVKTPVQSKRVSPSVYVSPFVTTSRGKGSVKKENLERSIRGLPSFTKHNTPDKIVNCAIQATGAAYFHTVLTNEITRLLAICDTWHQYKESDDMSEDATELIDVAVGQANLLINKKFQQFRGLINSCESGSGDQIVTCEDLQGFWDMVYMQVENLNVRFNRLTEMRNNNWEEIKTEVKPKIIKKRAPLKKAKSAPSSNIRAAIKAARMKSQQSKTESTETDESNKESVFNGGFFVVRSPHKSSPTKTPKKTPNGKRSLLVSVLSTEASKKQPAHDNSPGVTMMKASQTAKSIENISADYVEEFSLPTPGKSILKNAQNTKSYSHASKAVLFQDEADCGGEEEHLDQNKSTSNFVVEDSTEKTPKRKSTRSSIKK